MDARKLRATAYVRALPLRASSAGAQPDSQRALVTLVVAHAVTGTVIGAPMPSFALDFLILVAHSAVTVSLVHDLASLTTMVITAYILKR